MTFASLLVIQNDPEVSLGSFAEFLADAAVSYKTLHPYRGENLPPIDEFAAVIVLGGGMSVHDTDRYPFLLEIKKLIRSCVTLGVPFLGICLGGQLLADVLGGKVTTGSPFGEKGTLAVCLDPKGEIDPLFSGIPREFVSFQWHNDSFEIPEGADLLARSDGCPNQAFRYGESAWGVQFHPEADRAIVDCWARWSEETAAYADDYLSAFSAREDEYRLVSRRILANFLAVAFP